MPGTENATLDRIQREIQDIMEREKELKQLQSLSTNNNTITDNNNIDNSAEETTRNGMNGVAGQPLFSMTNGSGPVITTNGNNKATSSHHQNQTSSNFRRFVPNPNTKGVMQRFLKAKGKMMAVSALTRPKFNLDNFDSSTPVLLRAEPGPRVRKGFVPVEDRIKQEFQEAHQREHELKTLRKSMGNLTNFTDDYLDEKLPEPLLGNGMRATKSMAQLYDIDNSSTGDNSLDAATVVSAPGSLLKPARSLAELIDAKDEEDIVRPQSLILQFEKMIIKNKEAART